MPVYDLFLWPLNVSGNIEMDKVRFVAWTRRSYWPSMRLVVSSVLIPRLTCGTGPFLAHLHKSTSLHHVPG